MLVNNQDDFYITDAVGRVFKSIDYGVSWTKLEDFNLDALNDPKGFTNYIRTTNLTFQVRNCSLADCSDSSWQSVNLNNMNLSGRYFQYKSYFTSQDLSITPLLHTVDINYELVDDENPAISIVSPGNQSYTTNSILVNISASDENLDSIWWFNGTINKSYIEGNYIFAQGLNIIIAYANDTIGNTNQTEIAFYVDSVLPDIYLDSPIASLYNYLII